MSLILILLLCCEPTERNYDNAPTIQESFDSIDVFIYCYNDGSSGFREYQFGRILADGRLGIVATHSAYGGNAMESFVGEEFHQQAAIRFYDSSDSVHRRCTASPEHVYIHILPQGMWPPSVPSQLVTGFLEP